MLRFRIVDQRDERVKHYLIVRCFNYFLFFILLVYITLIGFGGRFPVFRTDDGQTDLTLLVDVRMIDFRFEANLWRLEGILSGEIDFNAKGAFVVRCVFLRAEELSVDFFEICCIYACFVADQHLPVL